MEELSARHALTEEVRPAGIGPASPIGSFFKSERAPPPAAFRGHLLLRRASKPFANTTASTFPGRTPANAGGGPGPRAAGAGVSSFWVPALSPAFAGHSAGKRGRQA